MESSHLDTSNDAHHTVVIVGGGQAGLALSYCLKEAGVNHVVFEKHRTGHAWRNQRWDSFCLVTPNWQCTLPGFPYAGSDPNGFMVREEVVRYIEGYVESFDPPLREGVAVTGVRQESDGTFAVETDAGRCTADAVVVATGGYHRGIIPRLAERFAPEVVQIHSADYKRPGQLPPGAVLVVGTGQSGCQIAEDLHLAGRTVHLSVGTAPRTARRYRGRDVVAWLDEMGHYRKPVELHAAGNQTRDKTNHYVTGRDGGRDIDLRRFACEGMRLHGRLLDVRDGRLSFADDLAVNLDGADAAAERIKDQIDEHIRARGISAPTEARYQPVWQPEAGTAHEVDSQAQSIRSVVWSTGFSTDYRWLDVPVFSGRGYPNHARGLTAVPGVYFLGLPWLHTWGSGRFAGLADDARYLAGQIVARHGTRKTAVSMRRDEPVIAIQ